MAFTLAQRHKPFDSVLYAGTVTQSEDPFFIVPAVVPDDVPVSRPDSSAATRRQRAVATSSQPTPTAPTVSFERPAVRRTTRIVRHIDPWSVFRVLLVFHVVLYLTLLLTGVLLWNVGNATGTVDNVERFMESFGWDSFKFKGGELFHQAWVLGLFAVVGLTGLAVLVVTTFNLITDLVGGIRFTVLEGRTPEKKAPNSVRSRTKKPTS